MSENKRKPITYVLWTLQVLLAALFIFAGVMKLVMPYEEMAKGPIVFSELFLRFIGVAELLGGLGLILPSLLRIKPGLTPLAAAGLVIIMIGATVTSLKMGFAAALIPLVVGLLLAFVAYGRWKLAPISPRSRNAGAGFQPSGSQA
jgi:putative oxidoreductase